MNNTLQAFADFLGPRKYKILVVEAIHGHAQMPWKCLVLNLPMHPQ
jgi:hypothetical protein